VESSHYLRPASDEERAQARERIDLSTRQGRIDAAEGQGRIAHLARVRTLGELMAVVDDLPPLPELRSRASRPPRSGPPAPARPPVPPDVRLPLTSPGRADAPPPDVPYGPYGDQFAGTDPRSVSHRVVPQVVPTAWGPTWQLRVVPQTNRWAITSLVLGIASMVVAFCLPIGMVGAVAGHVAVHQIRLSDDAIDAGTVVAVGVQPQTGRGLAVAGLVLSYVGLTGWGALLLWLVLRT